MFDNNASAVDFFYLLAIVSDCTHFSFPLQHLNESQGHIVFGGASVDLRPQSDYCAVGFAGNERHDCGISVSRVRFLDFGGLHGEQLIERGLECVNGIPDVLVRMPFSATASVGGNGKTPLRVTVRVSLQIGQLLQVDGRISTCKYGSDIANGPSGILGCMGNSHD